MPPQLARGEIWVVNLNPAIGMELQKVRPAIIISSDTVSSGDVRLVVPITGWSDAYKPYPWMVRIQPSQTNGLEKLSAANPNMTRSLAVNVERFKHKLGIIEEEPLEKILAALAVLTEMQK